MTKKQEQLMICPDKKCSGYGTKETPHCRKHKCCPSCQKVNMRKIILCPACIPYEPQPATCPDCGHLDIAHTYADGCRECECAKTPNEVRAKTPSELQPKHCTSPESQEICLLVGEPSEEHCEGCVSWRDREQPTPTMPLITRQKISEAEHSRNSDHYTCDICPYSGGECDGCTVPAIESAINNLLPAHDSEVAKQAVKEFADKVCEDMPLAPFIGGLNPESPEAFDLLKKGIALRQNICNWVYRAMAERKE